MLWIDGGGWQAGDKSDVALMWNSGKRANGFQTAWRVDEITSRK